DATAGELRSAGRALTGAAGALLLVGLAATTADLAAALGGVRALAGGRLLGHHDLVDQRDVDLGVEDFGGEVDLDGLNSRRGSRRGRRRGSLLGRRHGQASFCARLAAERRTSRPPLGPGTAPLSRIRPFSASTAWTVTFWVVTVSRPIWPDIRTPLNTRPGVAQAPIEPGLRWLRWAPCEAPTPWKPCRFMVP